MRDVPGEEAGTGAAGIKLGEGTSARVDSIWELEMRLGKIRHRHWNQMQSYRVENGDLVLLCGLEKRRSPGQCSMRTSGDFEMAVVARKKGPQEKAEVCSEGSSTHCASADLG